MGQNTYQVIGLMSGTSLDGLDIAFCHFELKEGKWQFSIEETAHIPYSIILQEKLRKAVHLAAAELLVLNVDYGQWTGQQVRRFIESRQLKPDFIASHGHTVHHQPALRMTCQIGAPQEIANRCGFPVIGDFRTLDVLLGGQGAPLVPVGDERLFDQYDFCLNLGGISNVSFRHQGQRVAYDIGLANMLLNYLAGQLGLEYDRGGAIAASGTVDLLLLNQLNALPYYQQPFPKSLGYEWFLAEVVPLLEQSTISLENKLATSVRHISQIIAGEIKKYAGNHATLLITGGGAKNDYLIECLDRETGDQIELQIPDQVLIDFKEAMIFAFMGVLRMREEVNCLCSVTGAEHDSCSGVVFKPAKNK